MLQLLIKRNNITDTKIALNRIKLEPLLHGAQTLWLPKLGITVEA